LASNVASSLRCRRSEVHQHAGADSIQARARRSTRRQDGADPLRFLEIFEDDRRSKITSPTTGSGACRAADREEPVWLVGEVDVDALERPLFLQRDRRALDEQAKSLADKG
jgi:hypothetical protein